MTDDPFSFSHFFYHQFAGFFSFADFLLHDSRSAKNVTAEAFFLLWMKIGEFTDEGSIKAFLYTAIRDNSLNYLKNLQRDPAPSYYVLHVAFADSLPPSVLRDILGFVDRFEAAS